MTTRMTADELDQLHALNKQRDPLQDRLTEEAERLFNRWDQLNPMSHGHRNFKRAELIEDNFDPDEKSIRIHYEQGCGCGGHNYDEEYEDLPLSAFLSSEWEDEAKATIADRADSRRRTAADAERTRDLATLADLKARYPDA